MASGNKTVQVTAYDTLRFSWQENSQSIANNQTVVGWKVELIATDYGRINSTGGDPWSVTVNGTKYSGSCDVSIGNNTTKTLASGTTTVPHGSDGKKVFSYSFTVSFDGIYFSGSNIGVKSGSGSGTLTTIPRTSSFTIPSSAAAGADIPVSITRAVSSFTHDVKIQLGNKTQTYTGIATSVNVTVPLAWLDQIPDNPSGVLTITVTTKSGSAVIGSSSKPMTITVPESVVPMVSIKAVTPIDQTWGLYIQGKSKVKIELLAAGAYGSTIKSYSIVGAGYTGTTNPYTTGILLTPGTHEFVCRVVDSRKRPAEVKASITVTEYEPPKFDSVQAFRSDADGASDRAGAYAYVKASRTYSSCGGNNSSSMTVAYKAENASSYGTAVSLQHGVGKVIGGSLATNVKYLVKITVADYFTSVYQELVIETDKYRAVLGEEAAGILMYPPDGGKGVYIGNKLHLDENVGLHVMDLRDRPQKPDMFGRQAFAVYFARENGSAGSWRGILHTKAFGGDYDAFEIAGPASQNSARYLAWRCGSGETGDAGGSFAAWRTILDDALVKDYVVERGTSGIWTYRKWNSGAAECWGKTAKTISCTNAWGSGLYLDSGGRTYADYPSGLFNETPVCEYSVDCSTASVLPMPTGTVGTASSTPAIQFCRGTSASNMPITVMWHAMGKWK